MRKLTGQGKLARIRRGPGVNGLRPGRLVGYWGADSGYLNWLSLLPLKITGDVPAWLGLASRAIQGTRGHRVRPLGECERRGRIRLGL